MPSQILDRVVPGAQFGAAVRTRVHAPAEQVFDAVRQMRLDELPLLAAASRLRWWSNRWFGRGPASPASFLSRRLRDKSVLLHRGKREIVFGSVGRLHRPLAPELVPLRTVPEFTRFHAREHEKLAVSIRMLGENPRAGVVVIVEYRVLALDGTAAKQFARTFTLLKPFAALAARQVLRTVKSRAEAGYRPPVPRVRAAVG